MKSRRRIFLILMCCVGMLSMGCSRGNGGDQSQLPPVDDSRGAQRQTSSAPKRPSIVNKKNAVILMGAAALYYMYKKRQTNAQAATGPDSQYYLSKNGRVYYRDESGRSHWVTPPSAGIEVPMEEAQQYQEFQGYNRQAQGRDLVGLGRE